MGFLSTRRYELLALAIAIVCAALHIYVDSQPTIGLPLGPAQTSAMAALVRGIQQLEGRAMDLKFRFRGKRPPHPDVVVVAIDEKSAQKHGLWPWPRDVFAKGIESLVKGEPAAIGLDISFTDAVASEGDRYKNILEGFDAANAGQTLTPAQQAFRASLLKQGAQSPDDALEKAFREAGKRLVQGTFAYGESEVKDFSPEKQAEYEDILKSEVITTRAGPGGSVIELPLDKLASFTMLSAQTPLRRLTGTGTHIAHVNTTPDVDGTIRRVPLLIKLEKPKGFLPSLSIATAATALDAKIEPLVDEGLSVVGARLRKASGAPIDVPYQGNEAAALINHVGPGDVFQRLSMGDFIDGTADVSAVKGKTVLIGVTLTGSAGDQRMTPFKELEPGIFTHASMVSNILSQEFLTRPSATVLVESLAILLIALLLARLIPRLASFSLKLLVIFVIVSAWLGLSEMLFTRGIQLATMMPLLNVLGVSFGLIFLGYLSVDREKLKLRSTFTKYLGEDVMEEALKNPDKLNRGEKREMSVLFSDIRGFTTLSERMVPEKLADFIKEYLSPMTQIVFEEKGTLDKYIGDAVMAFWNAPLDQPDHAVRAGRAALAMLKKLETLKLKWRADNLPEFDIGIGINSGPMIVGNMGSDVRVDYTVMGDAVNLASRLEGTNKEYETRIIISEGTYEQVKSQLICRILGAVRVKGKRKPVKIYELRGVGQAQGVEAEAIAKFEAALQAYTEQKFDEAGVLWEQVLLLWKDDAPTRRYLDEVAAFKANPPGPTWDGVYTATSK
ncbi:MAG: adenylate/guanylate cyclase domain-containing protein [Myxococcaceae bacterium]|nr:adenylate/guanylate cyclase domain-containing protein [Myxococcaceae bacterium]